MRLLLITTKSRLFHFNKLCNELNKFGIECQIINDEEFLMRKIDFNIFNRIKKINAFKKVLSNFKPNLVLLDRQTELGLRIIKEKIPYFVIIRGDYWEELELAKKTLYNSKLGRYRIKNNQKIVERCFEGASMILVISNYLHNIVRPHYPDHRIEVLYNSRDPNDWQVTKNMKLQHPCVGLLQGANIWGKTEELLILSKVLEALPHVTFYWAGDGPYRETILSSLQKYSNFKWLGHLEYPNKVREYLSEIDVYALITGMDTLGQTILEASLMQRPIIATNVGGISEVLIDGKTGFLVRRGDHVDLIDKLNKLLNDRDKREQMGNEGLDFIRNNFTWEITAKRLAQLINETQIE